MPLVDPIRRTIALKFVYYGPTGVGKTASLKLLEQRLQRGPHSGSRGGAEPANPRPGRLLCLDTLHGHTLFFETLSIAAAIPGDGHDLAEPNLVTRLLLRLFSVPGGDMHRHTRRLLLRGADGIMLVGDKSAADSTTMRDEGSLGELRSNLREFGISSETLPILVQPSPTAGSGDVTVVESLIALLISTWPTAEHAATVAGLAGCELSRIVSTLRKRLGVPPLAEAPLQRPDSGLWQKLSERMRCHER